MNFLSHFSSDQIKNKRFLLRADFNVPIENKKVGDDTRIRHTLPTLQRILKNGGSVAICSHLGRPKGKVQEKYSLAPVAKKLAELIGKPVRFLSDIFEKKDLQPGNIVLLENTRFFPEEEKNDAEFAKKLTEGCDFFVNDAFGTAHRAHASTTAAAEILPSLAGLLLEQETEVLTTVLKNPEKPLVLVTGGAKMETKIGVLEHFVTIAESILVGGGIANTFLAAMGNNIGDSLYEKSEIERAKKIVAKAKKNGCNLLLPVDAVVSQEISETASVKNIPVGEDLPKGGKILDIGVESAKIYAEKVREAKMIVWNGPVGIFELTPFANGTRTIAEECKKTSAKTILGGGDTLDAIARFGGTEEDFFHLSTGGGAMLEFLEGKSLPGIEALENSKKVTC